MARRALRPCRHPGCPELTRDGWCDKHRPPPRQTRRKDSAAYHSWYSKAIWTEDLRPAQLIREPWCRVCAAKGWRTRATVVDHVVPFGGLGSVHQPGQPAEPVQVSHDQKTAREQAERQHK